MNRTSKNRDQRNEQPETQQLPRKYNKPAIHELGQLEQVQGLYHGAHYDGPSSWLLYDY